MSLAPVAVVSKYGHAVPTVNTGAFVVFKLLDSLIGQDISVKYAVYNAQHLGCILSRVSTSKLDCLKSLVDAPSRFG